MTPDAFSNLQVINCTAMAFFSGNRTDHGPNEGFYHQYQMYSWFPETAVSSIFIGSKLSTSYNLQFLRGVGDEDDGADMQINIGSGNMPENNVAWIQGRSSQNSAHFIQAQIQQPSLENVGPVVVATTAQGKWPMDSSNGLTFSAPGQLVQLGLPSSDQSLASIDLQVLFPPDAASLFQKIISDGVLSQIDSENIWIAVMRYLGWTPVG